LGLMRFFHFAGSFARRSVQDNSLKTHIWISIQAEPAWPEAKEKHLSRNYWTREIQGTSQSERNTGLQNNKTFLTPKKSKTVPPLITKLFRKKYKAIAYNLYEVNLKKAENSA